MKSFRKLLKGITGSVITIFVLAVFLFILIIFCGIRESLEYLIGLFLFYLLFMGLVFAALLIYGIVVFCTYEKAKDKLRAIPGFSEERFERETARAPKINNILLCSDAICYCSPGYLVKTIPIQDIVWAYQEQVQNGMYMQIYTKDKEKISMPITIKKKFGTWDMACGYILRLIARKNKGVLIGYEDTYEDLYKRDFDRILRMTRESEIVDSRILEQEYVQNNYYEKDFH